MGFFDRFRRKKSNEDETVVSISGSTELHPCPPMNEEEKKALMLLCGVLTTYTDPPSKELEEFCGAMMEHILVDNRISEIERNMILSSAEQLGASERPEYRSFLKKIKETCR